MAGKSEYHVTLMRVISAFSASAAAGTLLTIGLMITLVGPPAPEEALTLLFVTLVYWMAGLLLFMLLPFAVFHYLGLRQWWVMTGVGAGTMVMLGLYLLKGIADQGGILVVAILGGLAGWIIWRVAYRRMQATGDET